MDAESLKVMNQDFVKLNHFDRNNFTRWQSKVMFLLMALKIAYVLDPNLPAIPQDPVSAEGQEVDTAEIIKLQGLRAKRAEDEALCKGHIVNTLMDILYDLYNVGDKTARQIWTESKFKYKAEEECTNRYFVVSYFDFKIVDNKPIMEQVHELHMMTNKMHAIGITFHEFFQVGAVIAKLPPSWEPFQKKMIAKSEDISLEQIQMPW